MSRSGGISDREVLGAVLSGAVVRVAAFDRSGRFLLDPDPNPPLASDSGAPAGASIFELYANIPGIGDAMRAAFAGQQSRITRQLGGATYVATFLPRREPDGSIEAVFVVATIATEGTDVERALADVQTRERRIFHSSMVGMLYWTKDGTITDANETFLSMVGRSRDELAQGQLNWCSMTPEEFQAADDRGLAEIAERGSCVPFEKEIVHRDGRRVSVLIGGASWTRETKAGVAFVVDISERNRQEREHRLAQERLQRVVEATPIVLWAVDVEGLFTLSVGRGLASLGLEPGQVVGQSVFELYAGVPQIALAVRRALAGEEILESVDVGGLTFEGLYTPLRDGAGNVSGVLGVAIDVTARKRAEVEQEKLKAQLLQVQKLESLGLLAGGIAHDFNNILTPILGAASSALMTIPRENPAYRNIEAVIAAAQRAAGLTRQMLAYSGKAQVEIRPIDLSIHVREIASLLETTVPKLVKLRLELELSPPPIEADVSQIQQVVMNLVINGAEAIGDQQGTVLVSTGRQRLDEAYVASLFAAEGLPPGDYVFLEVHDTGCGMDQATKEKIFDPFFTTKFTGRGLGLAAVLGIVRAHRGAIKVYSSPGHGTTFKVFFPATTQALRPEPRDLGLDYRGAGLVLVIDDDQGVRRTACGILELFGFTVIDAEDGVAGTAAFAERANEVVLVIVDMTMPKMNGEETFRALRRIREDVPVILTSGYNEIEVTRRFTSKGLAGFLEKPFTPAELASKLAAALHPKG